MKPMVCVLRTDGTNCDEETAYAFEKAGGHAVRVHVNQLRDGEAHLGDYQILVIPGGFSYGDDVASGKILAIELISYLRNELEEFVSRGKLVLGICNGFQVLVRTGLLPFRATGRMPASLVTNDSGHFECRWITMVVEVSPCVFTRELEGELSLPVAHGEGKFYASTETLAALEAQGLITVRYSEDGKATLRYPANPNGSVNGIAGICDPTGRIFGLMPHPERFVELTQYPNWRRQKNVKPNGLPIFESAIQHLTSS